MANQNQRCTRCGGRGLFDRLHTVDTPVACAHCEGTGLAAGKALRHAAGPAQTFTHDRPSFRERVFALAGRSTYREPLEGASTTQRQIPSDHIIAAALSFGRQSPQDMGPDIAFDMATGRPGHQRRVCFWLAGEIASAGRHRAGNMASARRCAGHAAPLAIYAYNAVVRGWECPPEPSGVAAKDWGEVLLFACLMLEHAAEDALALAAHKQRAA